MKKAIIIPARYSSSRLPGKPLMDILGKPMVVRVCDVASQAGFDVCAVATDHKEIQDVVEASGFQAIMTREDHVSGTDRLREAAEILNLDADDIVINLQGDEPLMPVENLVQVAQLLVSNSQSSVATLFEPHPMKDFSNPNFVKLVQGQSSEVLYFSRAMIPYDRDQVLSENETFKRHVGVYAYRKSVLDAFVSYPEGKLECLEKLEQLRFMEHGHIIVADQAKMSIPAGVDTQEDLDAVRQIFERNEN